MQPDAVMQLLWRRPKELVHFTALSVDCKGGRVPDALQSVLHGVHLRDNISVLRVLQAANWIKLNPLMHVELLSTEHAVKVSCNDDRRTACIWAHPVTGYWG